MTDQPDDWLAAEREAGLHAECRADGTNCSMSAYRTAAGPARVRQPTCSADP